MTGIDLEAVSSIASFLVILYVFGAILNYTQAYIFSTSIQHFSKRLPDSNRWKNQSFATWLFWPSFTRRYPFARDQWCGYGSTISQPSLRSPVLSASFFVDCCLGDHVWDELDFGISSRCYQRLLLVCGGFRNHGQVTGLFLKPNKII